jgi:Ca2+-binding RTX toxin-like protein
MSRSLRQKSAVIGKAKDDILVPGPVNDVFVGDGGDNTLIGTPGGDSLDGLGGNDTLIGLGGNDLMTGGTGDDIFHVEDAGDLIGELSGGGVDRIAAYVSYALAAGVEIERIETITLSDTGAINLTGNELGQTVIGNAGANVLDGGGGNDVLAGLGGNDTLVGGTGNDFMQGGTGNDIYFVDSAGDSVFEAVGEGVDRIASYVSYVLSNDAEIETLEAITQAGTDPIDLTGNGFSNQVIGNAGNNRLDGGAGNDRMEAGDGDDVLIGGAGADQMVGGLGNDTYYVDNAGDTVTELSSPTPASGGTADRVATSVTFRAQQGVEILEAINVNDTTAINLRSTGGATIITGNQGANLIESGVGNCAITGLGGADTFIFRSRPTMNNPTFDRILDFTPGTDKIALDQFGFETNLPLGTLSSQAFAIGSPQDSNDYVVYNPQTGEIFWDSDGNGTAQAHVFAKLEGAPTISASDFMIIGHSELVI